MSSRIGLLAIAAVAWLAVPSCADFSRGPASPGVDGDAGGDAPGDGAAPDGALLSFAGSIHPLLTAACQSCHTTNGQAADTQLLLSGVVAADYTSVSRFVDTAAPAGSRLLSKASGHGHGGGNVLDPSSPEYRAILAWIQQGARP